jgi:hypothetical protein
LGWSNFVHGRRLCDPRLDPDRRADQSTVASFSQDRSEHDGERVPAKEALAITFSVGEMPMLRSAMRGLLRHREHAWGATMREVDQLAREVIPIEDAARDRAATPHLRSAVTVLKRRGRAFAAETVVR